jgi:hypothetical protein
MEAIDAEKFPEPDCLKFASTEDANRGMALFTDLMARINKLEGLVRLLEWGSCDGCGNHNYCPLCYQEKEHFAWDEDDPGIRAGIHKPNCPVKLALG